MICKPCGDAGDLYSAVKAGPVNEHPIKTLFLTKITELHAECVGGTWCDCQHKIPEVVPA